MSKDLMYYINREGLTVRFVAEQAGMSEKQFLLCAEKKKEFKVSQIAILVKLLHMTADEGDLVFFDFEVA